MRVDDKTVSIDDVVCMKETPKALMIAPAGIDEPPTMWIPKSQIHPTSQINVLGDVGVLVVSEWLFKTKQTQDPTCWEPYQNKDVKGEKNG